MRFAAPTCPAETARLPRRPLLSRFAEALTLAPTLARSRRALGHLDDHLLRDIGLHRAEAEAEARRPLWDAPAHWRD